MKSLPSPEVFWVLKHKQLLKSMIEAHRPRRTVEKPVIYLHKNLLYFDRDTRQNSQLMIDSRHSNEGQGKLQDELLGC